MMHPCETTIAEMLGNAEIAPAYLAVAFGRLFSKRACEQGFQESLVHFGGGLAHPSTNRKAGKFESVLFKMAAENLRECPHFCE